MTWLDFTCRLDFSEDPRLHMINPISALYEHKGRVIPILIIGQKGEQFEAFVEGDLRKIKMELAMPMQPASSKSF